MITLTITLHDGTVLRWTTFDNTRETWEKIEAEVRARIAAEDQVAELEALVIELGGVGALPIEGERSAAVRAAARAADNKEGRS